MVSRPPKSRREPKWLSWLSAPRRIDKMVAGRGGWSEWVHPVRPYRMICCDCGLIHEAQFAITERLHAGRLNRGEDDQHVIVFRMRRKEPQ